jgi:transcription initiation factor TFIIB
MSDDDLFNSDVFISETKDNCCDISTNIVLSNDSSYKCKQCDRYISSITDTPEWRYYGSDDSKSSDPTRCGPPINSYLPKSSVGTSVSNNTNKCDNNTNKVRRFQTWNSMTYKERSLNNVYKYITEICLKNNINQKIINESKALYTLIAEVKISRGVNRTGIIVASVFYACKNCDVPRSDKELSKIFDIENKVVTNGIKKFREILSNNRINNNRLVTKNSITPMDLIERYCSKLNIDDIESIKKLCNKLNKHDLISENTPPSISAGCIYYYSINNKNGISKKDIHNVCEISEVTINKCYKKICEALKE